MVDGRSGRMAPPRTGTAGSPAGDGDGLCSCGGRDGVSKGKHGANTVRDARVPEASDADTP